MSNLSEYGGETQPRPQPIPDARYATPSKEYLDLPDVIRAQYTYKQWAWLSGDGKTSIVERSCDPDWTEAPTE